MNKLILVGSGGHFRSVYDSLDLKKYSTIVLVDSDKCKWGTKIKGLVVVGGMETISKLKRDGFNNAFICIGDSEIRFQYSETLLEIGFNLINIFDKSSDISDDVIFGYGNFVGKKTVINSGSQVGNLTIINTGAIVEHDCIIEDYSFVAPGVVLTGGVVLKRFTYIGSGAVINPYLKIGENTTIGSGSVVTRNIDSNILAYGSPCKEVSIK